MITLSGLEKSFSRQKVLHDISLTIPEGSVTALIGPSGSGKSTLLRCINLLEIAQAGKLTIGNEEIIFSPAAAPKRKDVRRICQQTGMVFQNFQLFPHLSVLENIMQGLVVVQKWPRERARARAEALLAKVGLVGKEESYPRRLSGGQQQRLCIARALAVQPQVLLMDEPTSALDPISTSKIEELAMELKEKYTIVIVTHNMQQAVRISDKTAFFLLGEVVEFNDTDTLFSNPQEKKTEDYITGRFG